MKKNKKLILLLVIISLLCMYYLGVGIFFMCIRSATLLLRVLAVVIPAVFTAVSLSLLVWRIIIAMKRSSRA